MGEQIELFGDNVEQLLGDGRRERCAITAGRSQGWGEG